MPPPTPIHNHPPPPTTSQNIFTNIHHHLPSPSTSQNIFTTIHHHQPKYIHHTPAHHHPPPATIHPPTPNTTQKMDYHPAKVKIHWYNAPFHIVLTFSFSSKRNISVMEMCDKVLISLFSKFRVSTTFYVI